MQARFEFLVSYSASCSACLCAGMARRVVPVRTRVSVSAKLLSLP